MQEGGKLSEARNRAPAHSHNPRYTYAKSPHSAVLYIAYHVFPSIISRPRYGPQRC